MIPFYKYHGTGNDFIIIDQRQDVYLRADDQQKIAQLCHRRFGIGADGLMFLEHGDEESDFRMVYYNSDGNISSMCGNGGRCISHLAHRLGLFTKQATFKFESNLYYSSVHEDSHVSLKMQDVQKVISFDDHYILNTGSPHFVQFRDQVSGIPVKEEGASIRYGRNFRDQGINVNFCAWNSNSLEVRTYERGVEDETYSCGTGVVAAALAWSEEKLWKIGEHTVQLQTQGGTLSVKFNKKSNSYSDIFLIGPATLVFEGKFEF